MCSAVSYFSTLLGSIIGAGRLSFRVRDGTGRFPAAMAAVTLFTLFWASHCVLWEICGVFWWWSVFITVASDECVRCVVWLRASRLVCVFVSYTVCLLPQFGVCVSFRPVSASSLNSLLSV